MEIVRNLATKIYFVQTEARECKQKVNQCTSQLAQLELKMADIEDRARRKNIRLVGLKEGVEGSDPMDFLQKMLPQWISSITNKSIEIERAHRLYNKNGTGKTRTMIFNVLRYQDRQRILQEARAAGHIVHAESTLRFFADYSMLTSQRHKTFTEVRNNLRLKDIQSFLVYPASLRVTYEGEQRSFSTEQEAEGFLGKLQSREQKNDHPPAHRSSRRRISLGNDQEHCMDQQDSELWTAEIADIINMVFR